MKINNFIKFIINSLDFSRLPDTKKTPDFSEAFFNYKIVQTTALFYSSPVLFSPGAEFQNPSSLL